MILCAWKRSGCNGGQPQSRWAQGKHCELCPAALCLCPPSDCQGSVASTDGHYHVPYFSPVLGLLFSFFLDGINACSILKFNNYSIPQHNFMLSWCRLLMWYVALENKTGFYYFEQFSLVQHDKCKDAGTLAASFLRNTQVIYWKKCLVRKISKHHFNQFVWNIFFYILFLIITHER